MAQGVAIDERISSSVKASYHALALRRHDIRMASSVRGADLKPKTSNQADGIISWDGLPQGGWRPL
jgi:hypothetical protein